MTYYRIVDPVASQGSYVRTRSRALARRHPSGSAARERRALIELNMAVAGLLGLDPHYTISTNLAWRLSVRTGIPFVEAKQIVHARIAVYVERVLRSMGVVYAPHLDISDLVYEWLESFDSSASW